LSEIGLYERGSLGFYQFCGTDHFNNNSNCYNDKFTLQEMQDAIADTNNSAPGKDRLSYCFSKYHCSLLLTIFSIFLFRFEVSEIGLYERGSLGFLPFLWIGIIIE
jgi:hypothetical protein